MLITVIDSLHFNYFDVNLIQCHNFCEYFLTWLLQNSNLLTIVFLPELDAAKEEASGRYF